MGDSEVRYSNHGTSKLNCMLKTSVRGFIVKLIWAGAVFLVVSGCSLAVDTQQEISIPVRKDGFEINAPSTERLKDVVDEYQPSF